MQIAEIFESVQGEGRFLGTPSVFVRTSGCNLRCWYCDTPYTSWEPEGIERSWESVLGEVEQFESPHVVVTGGEPMLHAEMVSLTRALAERGRFVTIETAATVDLPVHADLMSISPKLSNSTPHEERAGDWAARHDRARHNVTVVRRLIRDFDYQLKFVIDQPADVQEVLRYLEELPQVDRSHVWLMPQATTAATLAEKTAWLQPETERIGLRFTSRLHIELYGNVRGK